MFDSTPSTCSVTTCIDCDRPMTYFSNDLRCPACHEEHEESLAPDLCSVCSGNGCASCNFVGETY